MEEKKFDPYQFIGFILIALILTWMLYRNGPAEEDANSESVKTEQVVPKNTELQSDPIQNDSLIQIKKVAAYGDLGSLFAASSQSMLNIETDQMTLEMNPK